MTITLEARLVAVEQRDSRRPSSGRPFVATSSIV
jgi:hypothetical protein